jgi:hypothetical protein
MNNKYVSWLSDLALTQTDDFSKEYEYVYNDFYSHSNDDQNSDLSSSNAEDTSENEDEEDDEDDSDAQSVTSDEVINSFSFTENDFENV